MKILANKPYTNENYRQVLFWPSEGLGQVTTKKKLGITRPRPDGGVIIFSPFWQSVQVWKEIFHLFGPLYLGNDRWRTLGTTAIKISLQADREWLGLKADRIGGFSGFTVVLLYLCFIIHFFLLSILFNVAWFALWLAWLTTFYVLTPVF